MIKVSDWDSIAAPAEKRTLPPDGYICRIKSVEVVNSNDSERMVVDFDIDEGEYKGFFQSEYDNNAYEQKRWKGRMSVFCPMNDGSDRDNRTKRRLKAFVTCVEHSNPGFKWNFDEKSFEGKRVGILFRSEEWEYNGKTGFATRPFIAISADRVKSGDYEVPEAKVLPKASAAAWTVDTSGEELPF